MTYEICITDHAAKRMKERLGITNPTTMRKRMRNAIDNGKSLFDFPTKVNRVRLYPKADHIYPVDTDNVLYVIKKNKNIYKLITIYIVNEAYVTGN